MRGKKLKATDSSFLEKTQLMKLRLRAVRAGVWFKALPRIDRVLINLTIQVTGSVRSLTLAKSIISIMRKLEMFLENKLLRAVREVGLPTAYRVSLFAQEWGNTAAEDWRADLRFARYWAVISLNEPKLLKG